MNEMWNLIYLNKCFYAFTIANIVLEVITKIILIN